MSIPLEKYDARNFEIETNYGILNLLASTSKGAHLKKFKTQLDICSLM